MWALAAHVAGQSGNTEEAVRLAERAEEHARKHGWPLVQGDALVARARALIKRAHPDQAQTACREALALFRAAKNEEGVGAALHWLGVAFVERGDAREARRIQLEALEIAERRRDRRAQAEAHYEIGLAQKQLGEHDEAQRHLRAALEDNQASGRALGTANSLLSLGEHGRLLGDLASAEDYYRRGLVIYERIGSPNSAIARLNLGLALLAKERWVEARRTLEDARAVLERSGWRSMLACAHVEIATAASGTGDWGVRDEHFDKARALLAEGIVADPDLGWAANLAGKLARRAGHTARAREAFTLARDQWVALAREDARDEAERELAALG
jgi:tetratricopeptide (TPR) repeat protein